MNILAREPHLSYPGWLMVAMACLANVITFGLMYSFSVFFKPVSSEFGWSRASTALAFSLFGITHDGFAFVGGSLTDKFGPKLTTAMGGFCIAASFGLMSSIQSIWEFYLYYGLIFGLGVAAIYGPMMSTVSRWFTVKRGLAMGLAASGSSLGTLVLSPLAAWLISSYGWRAAYFTVGALALIIFIPVTLVIKKAPDRLLGAEIDRKTAEGFSFLEALKTKSLWIFSFSWLFIALALFAIMVHIVPFLTDKGISLTTAGLLAGLIGGGGIIGRISAGFLSDKLGRKRVLLISFVFQLIMSIWLLFSGKIWMFFVFALLYGASFGGWVGVVTSFPADYFGLKATGAILGFTLILAGIGGSIGSYIGGYIFDITDSYDYAVAISAMAIIISILLAIHLKPPAKAGWDTLAGA